METSTDAFLCRADPELFFAPDDERRIPKRVRIEKAKAFCAMCAIRSQCLDYALDNPSDTKYGIWGGATEKERAKLREQTDQVESSIITSQSAEPC